MRSIAGRCISKENYPAVEKLIHQADTGALNIHTLNMWVRDNWWGKFIQIEFIGLHF